MKHLYIRFYTFDLTTTVPQPQAAGGVHRYANHHVCHERSHSLWHRCCPDILANSIFARCAPACCNRPHLKEELEKELENIPKTKVVRMPERGGACQRSVATGDIERACSRGQGRGVIGPLSSATSMRWPAAAALSIYFFLLTYAALMTSLHSKASSEQRCLGLSIRLGRCWCSSTRIVNATTAGE